MSCLPRVLPACCALLVLLVFADAGEVEEARVREAAAREVGRGSADGEGEHGTGDSNGALKAYQEATQINPTFAAAYTNLGTIYQVSARPPGG